ncbi:MAG: hypothetical protein ACPGVB_14705 [Chitinophagales bacterium]
MSNQNQLAALHDIAMEFVDEALFAQKRGDETTAQLFYQKAYNLERRYALSIPKEESYQLSRSVFLRSAATLALDCDKLSEANELANLALEDNPHPAIVPELEEVVAKAQKASIKHSDSPLSSNNFDTHNIDNSLLEKPELNADSESESKGSVLHPQKIQAIQIQLTITDENEANLLMQLLQKFDSVRVHS